MRDRSPGGIPSPQPRQDSTPFKGSSSQAAPRPRDHPGGPAEGVPVESVSWGPCGGCTQRACPEVLGGGALQSVLGSQWGEYKCESAHSLGPRGEGARGKRVPGSWPWGRVECASGVPCGAVEMTHWVSAGWAARMWEAPAGHPFLTSAPCPRGPTPKWGGRDGDARPQAGLAPDTHPGSGQGARAQPPCGFLGNPQLWPPSGHVTLAWPIIRLLSDWLWDRHVTPSSQSERVPGLPGTTGNTPHHRPAGRARS